MPHRHRWRKEVRDPVGSGCNRTWVLEDAGENSEGSHWGIAEVAGTRKYRADREGSQRERGRE